MGLADQRIAFYGEDWTAGDRFAGVLVFLVGGACGTRVLCATLISSSIP